MVKRVVLRKDYITGTASRNQPESGPEERNEDELRAHAIN